MENKMIENKKPEQERPEAEKTGMEKTAGTGSTAGDAERSGGSTKGRQEQCRGDGG